jgi:glycosyltransferase involved in cell wall biosynthesis
MRIGILALAAGRQAGGPETYEIELIRALSRCDAENEYVVFCTSGPGGEAMGKLGPNFRVEILRPRIRALSLTLAAPLFFQRHEIDVLHATYAAPPLYGGRLVLTVHGLVNFLHPEFFPTLIRWRLNPMMERGIRKATRILCVSEHARQQTQEMFRLDGRRLSVVYHGVSGCFGTVSPEMGRQAALALGISAPYLLFAGKIQAGKNIERLVEAYRLFVSRSGSQAALVLAGRPVDAALARKLSTADASPGRIVQTGYADTATLAALYAGAEALVFPSLFESFGLPILEAMASGTPVITSNIAAMPEIAGGAALLVDPLSAEGIAAALIRLQESPELKQELIRRGLERARQFSWEHCARATLAAYSEAMREV